MWRFQSAALTGGRGIQPHAPTHIGASSAEEPSAEDIIGRTFSYDANGNQLGWTDDKNARQRSIDWDDADRIQSIDDHGRVTLFTYDGEGQRVIKR